MYLKVFLKLKKTLKPSLLGKKTKKPKKPKKPKNQKKNTKTHFAGFFLKSLFFPTLTGDHQHPDSGGPGLRGALRWALHSPPAAAAQAGASARAQARHHFWLFSGEITIQNVDFF